MKILMNALVIGLLFLVGNAMAQDPCAGEVGAGYGLCNAYCEAMNCDGTDILASEEACDRVKSNYTRITGKDELPCEDPLGTCFTPEEIAQSVAPEGDPWEFAGLTVESYDYHDDTTLSYRDYGQQSDPEYIVQYQLLMDVDFEGTENETTTYSLLFRTCTLDASTVPITYNCTAERNEILTSDGYEACLAKLVDESDEYGWGEAETYP